MVVRSTSFNRAFRPGVFLRRRSALALHVSQTGKNSAFLRFASWFELPPKAERPAA